MGRKTNSEIRNIFEKAGDFPEGITHIVVTMTMGGPQYSIQHIDHKSEDRSGIFFHIPVSGRSEQDAMAKLPMLFEIEDLYPHLSMHENRVYLLKNKIQNEGVRKFIDSIDWIKDEHRSAISELHNEQKMPFHHAQINDPYGRLSFSFLIFFHKDFKTVQQQLAVGTFPVFSENSKQIGSAFAVEVNGRIRILTAAHVVANDGRRLKIKAGDLGLISVIGRRSKTADVGLLEPEGVFAPEEFLRLGNSSRCELSDTIYVCGYPAKMGLEPTVSTGHISKLNAEFQEDTGLLQISSAAINPNNSGGPVADFRGHVIGILTARALKSEAQNIAFAEPIEKVIAEFNL